MKRLSLLLAAVSLSGCALLANPVVQECAIPVARAVVASATHKGAAEAWMDVLQVTLRESSKANGHTDSQNPRSNANYLTKGGSNG